MQADPNFCVYNCSSERGKCCSRKEATYESHISDLSMKIHYAALIWVHCVQSFQNSETNKTIKYHLNSERIFMKLVISEMKQYEFIFAITNRFCSMKFFRNSLHSVKQIDSGWPNFGTEHGFCSANPILFI